MSVASTSPAFLWRSCLRRQKHTQCALTPGACAVVQAPSLITVSPAKYIYLREGVSAGPIGLDVAFAPASPAPPAAPAAPAAPGVNTTGYFPVLGG